MDVFLARQPILDRHRNLYGYELLYRSSLDNRFDGSVSRDDAAAQVIGTSAFVMGLDAIAGDRVAFVNVSERVLESDVVSLLPREKIVIELLEDVRPTPAIFDVCRSLRQNGYRLALDDFVVDDAREPLLGAVDIVKLDWNAVDPVVRPIVVNDLRQRNIHVLAEKVETWEDFVEGSEIGCSLFQGFFFSRPEMLTHTDTAASNSSCLQLLREVHQGDLDIERIERVLKSDISLSYKLLTYINSAAVGLRMEVTSIPHALVLLGERRFRQWATLATMANIGVDRPSELLIQAAIRGHMCESMAERLALGPRSQELFLVGMFSLLDAFTNRPMADVLDSLHLSDEVEAALLGESTPFYYVLDGVTAWERADGEGIERALGSLGLSLDDLCDHYQAALQWAENECHFRAA